MSVRTTQKRIRRGFLPSALGEGQWEGGGNQANSQGLLGALQANKEGEIL